MEAATPTLIRRAAGIATALLLTVYILSLVPVPGARLIWSGHAATMALAAAVIGLGTAAAWSQRHGPHTPRLTAALDLTLRIGFAVLMLDYGFAKLFGNQFNTSGPVLDRALRDAGAFDLAWRFFGYSRTYELFIAASEITAGTLVLFRRTAFLGGLIGIAIMANVAVVDFAFGIWPPLALALTLVMASVLIVAARPEAVRALLRAPAAARPTRLPRALAALIAALLVFPFGRHLVTAVRKGPTSPLHGRWVVRQCDAPAHPLCAVTVDTVSTVIHLERWGSGTITPADAGRPLPIEFSWDERTRTARVVASHRAGAGAALMLEGAVDSGGDRMRLRSVAAGGDILLVRTGRSDRGWPLDRLLRWWRSR